MRSNDNTSDKAKRLGKVMSGRLALSLIVLLILFMPNLLCGCGATNPTQNQSSSIDTVAEDTKAIREGLSKELDILTSPTAQELEGLLAPENCEMASHLLRDFSYEFGNIDVWQDKASVTLVVTCLDVSDVVEKGVTSMTTGDELQENARLYDSFDEEDRKALVRHVFQTLYDQIDATAAKKTYETTLTLTRDAKTNVWSVDEGDVRALIDGLFAV